MTYKNATSQITLAEAQRLYLLMSETARMIIEADYGCYIETPFPHRVMSIIHELARRVDSSIEEVAEHNIKNCRSATPTDLRSKGLSIDINTRPRRKMLVLSRISKGV